MSPRTDRRRPFLLRCAPWAWVPLFTGLFVSSCTPPPTYRYAPEVKPTEHTRVDLQWTALVHQANEEYRSISDRSNLRTGQARTGDSPSQADAAPYYQFLKKYQGSLAHLEMNESRRQRYFEDFAPLFLTAAVATGDVRLVTDIGATCAGTAAHDRAGTLWRSFLISRDPSQPDCQESFRRFRESFGDKEANMLLDQSISNHISACMEKSTPASCILTLKGWPDDLHARAQAIVDRSWLPKLLAQGRSADLRAYLDTFPDSASAPNARATLEKVFYQEARRSLDPELLTAFAEEFPDSPHTGEILQLAAEWRDRYERASAAKLVYTGETPEDWSAFTSNLLSSAHASLAPGTSKLSTEELSRYGLRRTVLVLPHGGKYFNGSGVIVSPVGHIITNCHVIKEARNVYVKLPSGAEQSCTIVVENEDLDIAILKADATTPEYAQLGNYANIDSGTDIVVIGNPGFGRGEGIAHNTVTKGVVSNPTALGGQYLQIDAAVNPGNSGGPVFDHYGFLIGIATFTLRGARDEKLEGMNFAVPCNQIVPILGSAFAMSPP